MSDIKKRVIAGLFAGLGAALALSSGRWVIRRVQRGIQHRQYQRSGTGEFTLEQAGSPHQPQDQPDRVLIPATGAGAAALFTAEVMGDIVEDRSAVGLEQLVAPLVQFLLTFQDFITVLRERRSQGLEGERSLTHLDRAYFQQTLERLSPHLEGYAEGYFETDSLKDRIYRLTLKVRDALENLDYSDDDLFRINGEVRGEACWLLREIEASGAGTDVDFDRVFESYEC
jgi:hypothetical protein